ncbi:hypothetical protein [Treponema pedis]|uniref:Uncharacterized protein n=1 Tax=Treponema pedis TaxID=409322 RepID=A0A7S7AX52_9SPIR|nr:hypothetical protein [Treponema pedis]QOW60766.1 hypothetical protein IFE08_13430 [Treponema pedis]
MIADIEKYHNILTFQEPGQETLQDIVDTFYKGKNGMEKLYMVFALILTFLQCYHLNRIGKSDVGMEFRAV